MCLSAVQVCGDCDGSTGVHHGGGQAHQHEPVHATAPPWSVHVSAHRIHISSSSSFVRDNPVPLTGC